jgi:hypothetical protein
MDRHSSVWVVQALPAALSPDVQAPYDYTGLVGVRGILAECGVREWLQDYPTQLLDDGVAQVLSRPPDTLDRRPYRASIDDKGIIDLVRITFALFGHQTGCVVLCYWLFLVMASACFAVRYFNQPWAQLLLLVFLLSHAALLPCVAANPQLKSVLAPRFLCVLGFVPTLHLLLEVLLGKPLSAFRALGVGIQSFLLVFVYHMRISAIWQIYAVIGAFVLAVLWKHLTRRNAVLGTWSAGTLIPGLLVVATLLAGLGGHRVYQSACYSELYRREGGQAHCFWHIMYSGLAYHPRLGKEHRLLIDDVTEISATGRFLIAHGRGQEWHDMGGSEDPSPDKIVYDHINHDRYDQAVKEVFFHTCRNEFAAVFSTMLYYKPVALAQYLAWHLRLVKRAPRTDVFVPGDVGKDLKEMEARMDGEGMSFRPWRPEFVVALLLFGVWAWRSLHRQWPLLLAGLLAFFSLSSLPSLAGYPAAHTMAEAVVSFGMLLFAGAVAVLSNLVSLVRSRIRLPASEPSPAIACQR